MVSQTVGSLAHTLYYTAHTKKYPKMAIIFGVVMDLVHTKKKMKLSQNKDMDFHHIYQRLY